MKSLCFTAVVLLSFVCSFAKTYLTPELLEPKVEKGCYQISSAGELLGFAAIVNGTFAEERAAEKSACGVLTADIHMNKTKDSVYLWTPIEEFSGSFDGQGHTLEYLYRVYWDTDNNSFIKKVVGGTKDKPVVIQNVHLLKLILEGESAVGLVSVNEGNLFMDRVIMEDNSMYADSIIGAMVGINASGATLRISSSDAGDYAVHADSIAGGFVGYNEKDATLLVENSRSYQNGNGYHANGGFLGVNDGSFTLVNSYSNIFVGTYNRDETCGAFLGLNNGTYEVDNSYYTGSWSDSKGTYFDYNDDSSGAAVVQLHNYNKNGIDGSIWGQEGSSPRFDEKYGIYRFKVTLISLGDTLPDLKEYISGEKMRLPTLKKSGFGFEGWYTNSKFEGDAVTEISPTESGRRTFYAKWEGVPVKPRKDEEGCFVISNRGELYGYVAVAGGFIEKYWTGENWYDRDAAKACVNLSANIVVNPQVFDSEGKPLDSLRQWYGISGFSGVFDGQYHTISGLYSYDVFSRGFFASTDANEDTLAVIKNVGFINSLVTTESNRGSVSTQGSGAVVGANYGNLLMERVYSDVTFCGNRLYYISGMVGKNDGNLTIKECANVGNLNMEDGDGAAGLVGYLGGGELHIANSFNAGNIYAVWGAGGLVGDLSRDVYIENSFNVGVIEGKTGRGPLLGKQSYSNLHHLTNVFYDDLSGNQDQATGVRLSEFSDGTVLKALREYEGADSLWTQEVGKDAYPVLSWISLLDTSVPDMGDDSSGDKPSGEVPLVVRQVADGVPTSFANIRSEGLHLHIEGVVAGRVMAVFDMQGKMVVAPMRLTGNSTEIQMHHAGRYLVRIGRFIQPVTVK
ncbi:MULTISPECIES: InlB B-repeat-containing protein [unclassified Fibrobacter]|uniref:InlB B-repeat-containing protein n=1 Tax=unclassified Fibrobacter TaxID=2634177 RepID=UPI000D6B0A1A|nr:MULTISPECIES: InlB B-repeat-containing protein [unclassified Fibrobacter]PWJ60782.1 putative repeat protein (TIGR02543 family) [Fibrobacter sp. UWR4]PZW64643.1 putative repeat protein (TIGR02543 family) [Fibrobacter sp. UWR1]